ncbi:type II toxin-antitoxin system HipA family toxin [Collimonas sp.]|jgi:serine/threonine-protein kinase HipA|uniref:type II toxin-antitoxin system HipA family toxin n=1 Tax=Collimonas sp. TaxID=1963772 RepID=UPI002CD2AC2A|nr:type II toxin-antitoxin system HipA family toxin [Collimonas sp.]HWW07420.1 type II toxin-antitoxin system HipA family toxin [Collimonas sp.]
MNLSALDIYVAERQVGVLFQYGDMVRFQVDPGYAQDPQRPTLSLSMRAATPQQDMALLLNPLAAIFNSPGQMRLPAFFQNLLPEGVLRKQIALERNCAEDNHFELLAACGRDLPGAVRAIPTKLTRAMMTRLVTQDQEAIEESVIAAPLVDGVSISGMQPKLALILEGGRYVSRTRHKDAHIIGKLPTAQYDHLPEVEHLSLQLAQAAGVTVCSASLQPLAAIMAEHLHPSHTAGENQQFLAVQRFDRDQPGRLHVEDFCQILGVDPDKKYTGASYADMALVMQAVAGLGEAACHELLRRITVNELIGNYDAHLKNFGIRYLADGRIEFSPAYDVVAYSVYLSGSGHALKFAEGQAKRSFLSPVTLRAFANRSGMLEPPLRQVISEVCKKALAAWPDLIAASQLLPHQKNRLMEYFMGREIIAGLRARQARQSAKAAAS